MTKSSWRVGGDKLVTRQRALWAYPIAAENGGDIREATGSLEGGQ